MTTLNLTPNLQRYLKLTEAQKLAIRDDDYEEAWVIEGAIERLSDKLTEEEKQSLYKIMMGWETLN